MLPYRKMKPGDRLTVYTGTCVANDNDRRRLEEVQVIKQYPHHTLVENRLGTRWSVTNAELYCEGAGSGKENMKIYGKDGKILCIKKTRKAIYG